MHSTKNIRREGSKLRTCALFKTEIGFENYLLEIKNPIKRILMTKFRLLNHSLMGRHTNLPKAMRFCLLCPRGVETEMHFLLVCPTYHALRCDMFQQTTRSNHLLNIIQLNLNSYTSYPIIL